MRIIGSIPHPKITITVFSLNDKYQLKFEAGPMEQTFKIPQNEISGMDGIKKLLDDEFMRKIMERFNEMYLSFKAAKEKNTL